MRRKHRPMGYEETIRSLASLFGRRVDVVVSGPDPTAGPTAVFSGVLSSADELESQLTEAPDASETLSFSVVAGDDEPAAFYIRRTQFLHPDWDSRAAAPILAVK